MTLNRFLPIALLALMCLVPNLAAHAQSFAFEGIAHDASGIPISDQDITVEAVIRYANTSGPAIYTERHKARTSPSGSYAVSVGEGIALSGNFKSIPWEAVAHFATLSIDASGDGKFAPAGAFQLTQSPEGDRAMLRTNLPAQGAPVSTNVRSNVRSNGKIVIPPSNDDTHFGGTPMVLDGPGTIQIHGSVSFQGPEKDVQWVGVNLRAIDEDGNEVYSGQRNEAAYQGLKAGLFTTVPRSTQLKLPHGGKWTLQLAVHKRRDGIPLKVHTYHLSAFVVAP